MHFPLAIKIISMWRIGRKQALKKNKTPLVLGAPKVVNWLTLPSVKPVSTSRVLSLKLFICEHPGIPHGRIILNGRSTLLIEIILNHSWMAT
jgi:hypothetical protein